MLSDNIFHLCCLQYPLLTAKTWFKDFIVMFKELKALGGDHGKIMVLVTFFKKVMLTCSVRSGIPASGQPEAKCGSSLKFGGSAKTRNGSVL